MLYLTIASVLVMLAGLAAVVVLNISWTKAYSSLRSDIARCVLTVDHSSQTSLRAELDALGAAVDKYQRATNRRLGGIWARIEQGELDLEQPEERAETQHIPVSNGETGVTPTCACGWCQSCQQRKLRGAA